MARVLLRNPSLLGDIAGLAVLAALYGLTLATVYSGLGVIAEDKISVIAIYLPFALIALFLWHQKQASKREPKWPLFALSSIGVGLFFFFCNIAIGHYLEPDLPLLTAAVRLRGPWGFTTTLLVCPGVTFLALSGWARSLLLSYIERA
ncbi:MAG: hypothetical protein ABSF94_21390 [Steroidobacteraceae bacterium]|jgi:hypothetical protein